MVLKVAGEIALLGAIASVFVVAAQGWHAELAAEEGAAAEYMYHLDGVTARARNMMTKATWDYETNITDYTERIMLETSLEEAAIKKEYWSETMSFAWQEFQNMDLKRMFQKYARLGTAALPEDLNQRLVQAIANMKSNYAKATICDFHNKTKCDLYVEPDVTNVFATSEDPEELQWAWEEWHKAAGTVSKQDFTEYVHLSNEAARLNGYDNTAEWWLSEYEVTGMEKQFEALWAQIKPLYLQMHAYVRYKLRQKYGEAIVPLKGPIPAHLLGNIWAQHWPNVEKFTRPYAYKDDIDISAALKSQNYTAVKLFQTANDFFKSLNLIGVPDLFWEKSIFERPDDGRNMLCHASAWDFFDEKDFRIRQCTEITTPFFQTTHHEMGHIQYYMQYRNQPQVYREGANPGFHEAVGDVIALSVATTKHLRKVGLLEEGEDDTEAEINQLFAMGLNKIAFLPFGYMLDLYRYSIFRGETTSDDYNCHFWTLREALQGLQPPLNRTEDDFDAAAKYHVSADVDYMRYYISYIIQFQFQQALCSLAGEYKPSDPALRLSNCDIYKSSAAGNALSAMLRLGSSKPWPDAMEALTGQRDMDASGLLEYFQPLHDWLSKENQRNGEFIGWEEGTATVEYCSEKQRKTLKDSDFYSRLKKKSIVKK